MPRLRPPPPPGPLPPQRAVSTPRLPRGGGRLRGGRPGAAAAPPISTRNPLSEGPAPPGGAPGGRGGRQKPQIGRPPPAGRGATDAGAGRETPPRPGPMLGFCLRSAPGPRRGGPPQPPLPLYQRSLSTLRGAPLQGPPGGRRSTPSPPSPPPRSVLYVLRSRPPPSAPPGPSPPGELPRQNPSIGRPPRRAGGATDAGARGSADQSERGIFRGSGDDTSL